MINYPGHNYSGPSVRQFRFLNDASAENAEIENRNGNVRRRLAGYTQFEHNATASNAMLTAFGAPNQNALPGEVKFLNQSTAGSATIIGAVAGCITCSPRARRAG